MIHAAGRVCLVLALLAGGVHAAIAGTVDFERAEIERILQHGPWPPEYAGDASNRVSGNPAAIALGQVLFFDPRLSPTGSIACVACHDPARAWTDGQPRSAGIEKLDRNAPTLLDVRFNRWFAWDGGSDSLWGHSLRPLLDAREMAATPAHVARLLREDGDLACRYRASFGRTAQSVADDETLLVDAAKALAAFQETLVSSPTAFDRFRDHLAGGRDAASSDYPDDARRGLKIFIGKGNCALCHFGAGFTNGEFADTGIPFFVAPGRVDPGRHGGIRRLKESRFTLLGRYNDNPGKADGWATRHVALEHRNWGEFKVPTLRSLAYTAPYMHNGSLGDLAAVVRHYSELDENRLHADGEQILKPLHLSEGEIADLVAFLKTLSAPPPAPPLPPAACR